MRDSGLMPQPNVLLRSHVLGAPYKGVQGPTPATKRACKSHVLGPPYKGVDEGERPTPNVLLRATYRTSLLRSQGLPP